LVLLKWKDRLLYEIDSMDPFQIKNPAPKRRSRIIR